MTGTALPASSLTEFKAAVQLPATVVRPGQLSRSDMSRIPGLQETVDVAGVLRRGLVPLLSRRQKHSSKQRDLFPALEAGVVVVDILLDVVGQARYVQLVDLSAKRGRSRGASSRDAWRGASAGHGRARDGPAVI